MQSIQKIMTVIGLVTLSFFISSATFAAKADDKKDNDKAKTEQKVQKKTKKKVKKKAESKNTKENSEDISEKDSEDTSDGSRYVLNCADCHGFDGNSTDPQWPNIAGLNKDYLTRQLLDFKSGKRVNEEMTQIVNEFPSDKELASLAGYFSEQKMINSNTETVIKSFPKSDLKLGEDIYSGKRIEYGIPACSACHGKDGMGDKEGKYPRLAGQHMGYIINQMEHFRSKDRSNDSPAQMQNITMQMDDEDIASVAAYIAYMSAE
ncbi:MAG: c-type cytochrome [Cocleimonas sp.]